MATSKKTTAPKSKAPVKAKAIPAKTTTASVKMAPADVAVKASQETVETVVKTSTAVARKGVEKAVAMGEEQVAAAVKAGKDAVKGYQTIIDLSRSNIDALVKSNEILSDGVRELNESIYKVAQEQFQESVELAQKMMTCTSPVDLFALQSDLVKKQYERSIAESRKISTLSVKLAEKAGKPIAQRVTASVDLLSKPIAA